jgi:hypothetical protein
MTDWVSVDGVECESESRNTDGRTLVCPIRGIGCRMQDIPPIATGAYRLVSARLSVVPPARSSRQVIDT